MQDVCHHRAQDDDNADARPRVAGRSVHRGATVSESEPHKSRRVSAGEGMRRMSTMDTSSVDYVISPCQTLSNETINTIFGDPHYTVSMIFVTAVLVAVVQVHHLGLERDICRCKHPLTTIQVASQARSSSSKPLPLQ